MVTMDTIKNMISLGNSVQLKLHLKSHQCEPSIILPILHTASLLLQPPINHLLPPKIPQYNVHNQYLQEKPKLIRSLLIFPERQKQISAKQNLITWDTFFCHFFLLPLSLRSKMLKCKQSVKVTSMLVIRCSVFQLYRCYLHQDTPGHTYTKHHIPF